MRHRTLALFLMPDACNLRPFLHKLGLSEW